MNRRSPAIACHFIVLLLVAAVVPAQDDAPIDEKLPPHLEGRSLIRPAERAAAGLDPYPFKNKPVATDDAASTDTTDATATRVATDDAATSPTVRTAAANDLTASQTLALKQRDERLARNEAMARAVATDPRVRQKAEEVADRLYPGPWSPATRQKLVAREIRRLILLGTDARNLEEMKKSSHVVGYYVTIDATDMPARRIADRMKRAGLLVELAPELADTPVTLKLDNVRGDLAVKRLAIELNAALFERPEGIWVIGDDATIRAAHADARRIAPLADPTPTPAPTTTPADASVVNDP